MSEGIVVAILGLLGSGLGSLCGVVASARLTRYRIEQLEKKVEKHNTLIDRTYQLEGKAKLYEQEFEETKHRISELEERGQ